MKRTLFVIRDWLLIKSPYTFFRLLIFLCSFHVLLFTAVSAADVDDIVDRIQQIYNRIHDIQGEFSQTSYLHDLERVEKYTGEFFIKKPFNMRWRYADPRDEEVIIRDTDTWIYKKSDKQVLRRTFSKEQYGQLPIALLSGFWELKTEFEIIKIKKGVLELRPKQHMGFIKKILLEISPGDFPVKSFSIFDAYGNKTDIAVKKVKINSGIKDSLFIFRTPPGVEVFDLN